MRSFSMIFLVLAAVAFPSLAEAQTKFYIRQRIVADATPATATPVVKYFTCSPTSVGNGVTRPDFHAPVIQASNSASSKADALAFCNSQVVTYPSGACLYYAALGVVYFYQSSSPFMGDPSAPGGPYAPESYLCS